MYDWSNNDSNHALWTYNGWKNYDILLGNSAITYYWQQLGYLPINFDPGLYEKMVAVLHSPFKDHPHYSEKIGVFGPTYCAITKQINELHGGNFPLLPIGVDTSIFYPTREITEIKKIGFIGGFNSRTDDVKRPRMFIDIARQAGVEPVFINGKPLNSGHSIYDDIDMLLYCSTNEGVATGIAEAAACAIPVICTKVGYANSLDSIKTFETVDEAVALIKSFDDSNYLARYITDLHREVVTKYNWKKIAKEYWEPVFWDVVRSNKN